MGVGTAVLNRLTYGIFARQPVSYAPSSNGYSSAGGASGPLDTIENVSTLYSIIDLLSTATAQVDWHLYRKTVDGRRVYGPNDDNRRQVTVHPALNLLDNPNPQMSRNELIQRTQQSIDLVGESFWVVEFAGKMPIELWPVRADKMTETLNRQGELVGWYYREPDGSRTWFPAIAVIHIQTPSPSNMFRGISPVRSLLVDLESVKAAGRFNLAFFRNSARPGGFVKVPNALGDTEFNRLQMQWREQHQGVNNAHRVGILENGMDWVDSSMTMLDMQFAELRNLSRDLIREAYRIQNSMLGQSEGVNFASALAADSNFAKWQLLPRLERIAQALNHHLLPLFGDVGKNVEFCFENPMPVDPEQQNADRDSKVKAAILLIGHGFDPIETLDAMGLPPITFVGKPDVPAVADPAIPTDAQLAAMLNQARTRRELAA